jgi:hypothetical protein
MSVNGSLKADQLILGRLTIDWLKQLPQVTVLAACVDSKTGSTRAWLDGTGIQWSESTAKALEALRLSIEEDIASAHMDGVYPNAVDTTEGKSGLRVPTSGLAEHLGTRDDTPSV